MRIDIVTIFPEFFSVLDVSLLGKARQSGLIDLHVHDLRDFTHDRHRTVDDTPTGGGAGMVMKPEPWGEALDAILGTTEAPDVTVVFPTPAGSLFTQADARDLSVRPYLVFCCGRYEGIDQRVIDHTRTRAEVLELSLGDYVLNGGEVAVMAMIEAADPPRPGHGRQPRQPARGEPRRRPARVPELHEARRLARPRDPAGAALRQPRRDRRLAPRAAARAHPPHPSRPAAGRASATTSGRSAPAGRRA